MATPDPPGPDPERSVVEPSPNGDQQDLSQYALKLRIRQQEILSELGVIALQRTGFTELLDRTVQLAAEGLEADLCKILEYITEDKRLLMRAGIGWDPGLIGIASVGADLESPSGFALHTGRPVISNHLESEQRFRTPDLLAAHGVRRAINVILQGDGAPYGVLEVDSRSAGEFSERDIAFLQGAANVLGMAIERQRQEQALKTALAHNQVLLKEINHRVKNSLQMVANMLRLQAGDDPHLGQRLQEASGRIMAIGRAHDRLYRSPQIEKIEMSDYLSDICKDLNQVIPNGDILFDASGQFLFNTDRAINVALVVTELVANAAKHAYPDGGRGPIRVRVGRVDDTVVGISVRDHGSGLTPDFEIMKGTGFGMRLVKALVNQMHGQLRVERHPPGTEFVLEIPIEAAGTTPAD